MYAFAQLQAFYEHRFNSSRGTPNAARDQQAYTDYFWQSL